MLSQLNIMDIHISDLVIQKVFLANKLNIQEMQKHSAYKMSYFLSCKIENSNSFTPTNVSFCQK